MAAKRIQPKGVLAKIDKHITSPLNLDSRQRHFYPTQASCFDRDGNVHGSCLRKVGYDFFNAGKSNPLKPDSYYTFGVGKHIELMLVDWFKEMGLFVGHNIKFFNPEFFVSGELDIVIRENPGSDVLVGIECKSSHGPFFRTEVVTGKPGQPPKPKDEHVMQVMLYLDNFPTLPYFVLVYVGRDDFSRTEYALRLVDVNGDMFPEITPANGNPYIDYRFSMANIYNRYKDMMAYIKEGTLPPCDYRPLMSKAEMEQDFADGKVTKAKMKKFDDGELLTADWQCVARDTKVLTDEHGWIPIQDIKKGDRVLSRKGVFNPVSAVMKTGIRCDMFRIKAALLPEILTTSDHEILVGSSNNYYQYKDKVHSSLMFHQAKDIAKLDGNHYLVRSFDRHIVPPIYQLDPIGGHQHKIDEELLMILGLFIAEGNYHKNEDGKAYKVQFTFNINETDIAEKLGEACLKYGATSWSTKVYRDYRDEKVRHSLQLRVYGINFVNLIKIFIDGESASTKSLGYLLSHMPLDLQERLLYWMNVGDGCILKARDSVFHNYSTTSKVLALQVQDIYLRLGKVASIVTQKSIQQKIGSYSFVRLPLYHIRWYPNAKRHLGFIKEGVLYSRILHCEPVNQETEVWDITVPETSEFLTEGGIVHNCRYCDYKDLCRGMERCKVTNFVERYNKGEFKPKEYKD